MGVIAQAIKHLVAAGVTDERLIQAISDMEAELYPARTARQDRNARYYDKHKERLKASETTEASEIKTPSPAETDQSVLNRLNASETSESDGDPSPLNPPSPSSTTITPYPPISPLPGVQGAQEAHPSPEPDFFGEVVSEKPAKAQRPTRFDAWCKQQSIDTLPEEWAEYARKSGLTEQQIAAEAEKFTDHWKQAAGTTSRKLDWPAAWRMWIRRTIEDNERKQQQQQRKYP